MRTEDMIAIAEEMNKAGFYSMEVWGGATFDVATRFLNEDPWERPRILKRLMPNTVTHAWIKLVRHAGLKPIRLHDARHSHASLMLKQGVHPKIVQERLGHSSIQITLDTYSHVAPGLQQAAAVRFDEAFSTRYNEPENEPIEKVR